MSAPQVVAGDGTGLVVAVRGLRPPHWMTSNHRYRHWSVKAKQTAAVRDCGRLWGRAMRDARPFVCVDPATITTTSRNGVTSPAYERRVDKIGTEVWALDAGGLRAHWLAEEESR